MKASKNENRFQTGFQQPKSGLQTKQVLTSLIIIYRIFIYNPLWSLIFLNKDLTVLYSLDISFLLKSTVSFRAIIIIGAHAFSCSAICSFTLVQVFYSGLCITPYWPQANIYQRLRFR